MSRRRGGVSRTPLGARQGLACVKYEGTPTGYPNRRAYMQGPAHRLERRACAALITKDCRAFGALPPISKGIEPMF